MASHGRSWKKELITLPNHFVDYRGEASFYPSTIRFILHVQSGAVIFKIWWINFRTLLNQFRGSEVIQSAEYVVQLKIMHATPCKACVTKPYNIT